MMRCRQALGRSSISPGERWAFARGAAAVAAIVFVCGLAPAAYAQSTFYVRPDGSDTVCQGTTNASASSAPNCAFAGVQKALNEMGAGDTVYIQPGTYVGNFNCCGHGDSSIETPQGSASAPIRILGAGPSTILIGTNGQAIPNPDAGGLNMGTITLPCNNSGSSCSGSSPKPKFVEVGHMTIRTGNAAAITAVRASDLYFHDLVMDDQSRYARGSAESGGLLWFQNSARIFVENVVVNAAADGGVRRTFVFSNGGVNSDSHWRMIDVQDCLECNIMPAHFAFNLKFEFIRLWDFDPWNDDDGAVIDSYNSTAHVYRYIDFKEHPSAATRPTFGHFNLRRTTCANNTGPGSLIMSNIYGEDELKRAVYGMMYLDNFQGTSPGCKINNFQMYNSVADNFAIGINAAWGPSGGLPTCQMVDWDYNVYVNTTTPVDYSGSGCNVTMGPHDQSLPSVAETNHKPDAGSALIDAGRPDTFEGTPYFPVPVGGGNTIDAGAYEFGAGAWPYEFQPIASVAKDPSAQTIRICWAAGQQNCDVTIPLWDPWALEPNARCTAPDWYEIHVDPSSSFHSGNGSTAAGFGAFYESQTNSSNRFHDISPGNLVPGGSYYVQVRVGETISRLAGGSDCKGSNGGWGPWSLGFYRFDVAGGSLTPPRNLRIVPRSFAH